MILRKETETFKFYNVFINIRIYLIIRMNDTPQGDGIVTIIKEI